MDAIATQFKGASVLELREIIDAVAAICPDGREKASTLYRVLPPEDKKNRGSLEEILRLLAQTCGRCKGVIDQWKADDSTWKAAIDVQGVPGWRSIFTGRKPPGYLGLPGSTVQTTSALKIGRDGVVTKSRTKLITRPFVPEKVWGWDASGAPPAPPPAVLPSQSEPYQQFYPPYIYGAPPSLPSIVPSAEPDFKHYDATHSSGSATLTEKTLDNSQSPYDGLEPFPTPQQPNGTHSEVRKWRHVAEDHAANAQNAKHNSHATCHLCGDVCLIDSQTYSFEVLGGGPPIPACGKCLDQHHLRCETCCKAFFGTRESEAAGGGLKCRECQQFEERRTICEICYEWTLHEKCHYNTGIEDHMNDPVCDDCLKLELAKRRDQKTRKKLEKKKRKVFRKPDTSERVKTPALPS